MFKTITLLFACLVSNALFGQNIVMNPSFETVPECPFGLSEINEAIGWDTPTGATPDLFRTCSPNAGVPSNSFGDQFPATGDGYAGIITLYFVPYVEYIQGHLMNMQAGQYYRVSMKVSLSGPNKYATSGLGIFFSVDSIGEPVSNTGLLPVLPQVDYSSYGAITDTANWVLLTDTLYADSAYKFLTIGRFTPDSLTVIDTVNYDLGVTYYYIDDVSVEPITLSVPSYSVNQVSIYPNPLTSAAAVNFINAEKEPYTFCLYNLQGQSVRRITNIRSVHYQ